MNDALTLNRHQQRTALAVALGGAVVPVVLAVLTQVGDLSTLFLVGATGGVIAPLAANLLGSRWSRARAALRVASIPALTLMQAGTGGIASPHSILLVPAMLYLAMRCTTRQLRVGVAVTIACCYLPMLLVGPPLYPVSFLAATEVALVLLALTATCTFVSRQAYLLTRKLNTLATHDPLTGLLNRRGWEERRAATPGDAARGPVVVVLIDLDGLKQVNDSLGHEAGDELIRCHAACLAAEFADGVVARLGGDEFAVRLAGVPETEVRARLDRLRGRLADHGGFSSGIALAADDESMSAASRRADLALYSAKAGGRGCDCTAAAVPVAGSARPAPSSRPATST